MDAKLLFDEFEKGAVTGIYTKSVLESNKNRNYLNDNFKVPSSMVKVTTYRYEDVNGNHWEISKMENVDNVYIAWSYTEPNWNKEPVNDYVEFIATSD